MSQSPHTLWRNFHSRHSSLCVCVLALQILMHVPTLRNFFLGEGHPQGSCPCARRGNKLPCLSCEMVGTCAVAACRDATLSETGTYLPLFFFVSRLACWTDRQQRMSLPKSAFLSGGLDTVRQMSRQSPYEGTSEAIREAKCWAGSSQIFFQSPGTVSPRILTLTQSEVFDSKTSGVQRVSLVT